MLLFPRMHLAMGLKMIGERFHRLVLLQENTSKKTNRTFLCKCDCGNTVTAHLSNLRRGATKSCGCWKRETARAPHTHGMSYSDEFKIWAGMKKRCENPNSRVYYLYGARGISVCERWQKFENFYADMGPRPSKGHSVDRIDGAGNYSPDNCKWATDMEQASHTSKNIFFEWDGETLHLAEIARRAGVRYGSLHSRIRKGECIHVVIRRLISRQCSDVDPGPR